MLTGLGLSAALVVVLGSVQPVASAGTPEGEVLHSAPFSKLFRPGGNPSIQPPLFVPSPEPTGPPSRQERNRVSRPQTKIICGMTVIIPRSPDPKMAKPSQHDAVVYTMRRMPPPACSSDK